jgi:hypothetical protein
MGPWPQAHYGHERYVQAVMCCEMPMTCCDKSALHFPITFKTSQAALHPTAHEGDAENALTEATHGSTVAISKESASSRSCSAVTAPHLAVERYKAKQSGAERGIDAAGSDLVSPDSC